MAAPLAGALLVLSLIVTLGAARMFAQRLDRLGMAFGLPEALLGLLTALAADGPEISSTLIAFVKGEHGVGVGVVVGAGVFNLATMVGLSALLAGAVALPRTALAVEGAMGLAAVLLASAVLLGWLAPAVGAVLLVCVGVPYVVELLRGAEEPRHAPASVGGAEEPRHAPASAGGAEDSQHAPASAGGAEHFQHAPASPGDAAEPGEAAHAPLAAEPVRPHHALWIVSDVALIVAGSFGMVEAAVSLGDRLGMSGALVGVLVLAPLTALPNAVTGIRLGLARRGAALVSESLNSNTINLAAGVLAPALFVTVTSSSTRGRIDLAWLLGMTCLTLLLLARSRGAGRGAGATLVVLYGAFVVAQLV
jgi:Ca2+/Na+ antiporter